MTLEILPLGFQDCIEAWLLFSIFWPLAFIGELQGSIYQPLLCLPFIHPQDSNIF